MSEFYLVNEKRFPLPVRAPSSKEDGVLSVNEDLLPYYRWEHRVTVGYNGRRYMAFLDNLKETIYVEDCTEDLKTIDDDNLWHAVVHFAQEHGYLNMMPPIMKEASKRFI